MAKATRLLIAVALLVLCALAGVAFASVAFVADNGRTPADRAAMEDTEPAPGTSLLAARVSDPVGGPDWGVHSFRNEAGRSCLAVGRVQDGRHGALDREGRFEELPLGPGATCYELAKEPTDVALSAHTALGPTPRTVLAGLANTETVLSVTIAVDDRQQTLRPTEEGAFVAVYEGDVLSDAVDASAEIHYRDGSSKVIALKG